LENQFELWSKQIVIHVLVSAWYLERMLGRKVLCIKEGFIQPRVEESPWV